MSTVTLSSFVSWQHGNPPKMPYALPNVPMPSDRIVPPKSGITMLYGFQSGLKEMSHWRREADKNKRDFYAVTVEVDVGELPRPGVSIADLPKLRFLHIERGNREFEDTIVQHWRRFLAKEGMNDNQINQSFTWSHYHYIAARPDLILNLWREKTFRHLDFIVYPVLVDPTNPRSRKVYRATLFRPDNILDVEVRNCPDCQVAIPKNAFPRVRS